ncbi:hypothetical protein ACJJIQ_05200 [Microbulbifer sp. ANSA003]|uniref:hypothetical protein n=1 Tax=Microbulbifer sp. ANSA003 TaxID=3243360 RepID=UPI0040416B0B
MSNWKSYRPELLGVLTAVLVLNALYLSGIAVEQAVIPKYYEFAIRAVITVGGVFVGAFLAFKLNIERDKGEEDKKQFREINFALLYILRLKKSVRLIEMDLEMYESHLAKMLSHHEYPSFEDLKYDLDELKFLVVRGGVDSLVQFSDLMQNFQWLMAVVKNKTQYYQEVVYPILSEQTPSIRMHITEDDFRKMVGDRVYSELEIHLKNIERQISNCKEGAYELMHNLRAVGKMNFPAKVFLYGDVE